MKLEQIEFTPQWYYHNMKKFFPTLDPAEFMDKLWLRTTFHGRWQCKIHLLKLDDWLHDHHPNYGVQEISEEGMSMKEALLSFYGEDATAFVEACI